MTSSQDAIKRVVEAFERSDWSEIDVRSGTLRVHLSTGEPSGATAGAPTAAPGPSTGATVSDGAADGRVAAHLGVSTIASADTPPIGAHIVGSPSPGILWRSPQPGSPPFADVGHTIDASATVCIIEVMKLMTHVKAGVSGQVVAVYGENGVAVHKGQVLFAIAPSASPS